jgi:hypothetical protein
VIFDLLKEIEKEVNRDEYISYGASYFLAVEELKFQITDMISLRRLFVKLETDMKEETLNPAEITDRSADFKMINDLWHFKDDITRKLMNVIGDADAYYRLFDKDDVISRGNVNDIFRIVKKDNELVLLEFYACD